MTFDIALRATEILLAWAFIQQSLEHLKAPRDEQLLFVPRLALAALLMLGIKTPWLLLGLVIVGLLMLRRFQGPYNGGSDRMSLLILCCLCLVHFLPTRQAQEVVFGYLALQLVLSYFISGWVKIKNPEWRSGRALQDVFQFSAYPVSQNVRTWAERPKLLFLMSWSVILFELAFPATLFNQPTLIAGLIIAATFHFTNACLRHLTSTRKYARVGNTFI